MNRISDVLIDGFTLTRGRRSGVDIEPDTGSEVISNIEVRNSTIQTQLLAFASFGPGSSQDIYVHDNTVTRSGVPWVYVRANDGTQRCCWTIENNTVTHPLGSPAPGILLDNVLNAVVRGNVVAFAPAQPTDAIGLFNGATATVECNWFQDAASVVSDRGGAGAWTDVNNTTGATPPDCGTPDPDPDPDPVPGDEVTRAEFDALLQKVEDQQVILNRFELLRLALLAFFMGG